MRLIIPTESILQNKGGVIIYNYNTGKIEQQYVHNKKWKRTGWRGGCLYKDTLITTDWTDLHYFDVKKWKYINSYKNNTFNDLHYLEIHNDQLHIVNTGLDCITTTNTPLTPTNIKHEFIFDKIPEIQNREIDLNEKWNEKFKTKHVCHPNCISFKDGKTFVTCFENRTRGKNTGKIIELKSGKTILDKFNCHDSNWNNNDLYLTHTRPNKIIVLKNVLEKKWPVKIDEVIDIQRPGWWRGMQIVDNKLYVFASYGYKNNEPTILCKIDLKTKKQEFKQLPIVDKIIWDTVYQPIVWLEG